MQISSANLLAAQQAAREAQGKFQALHAPAAAPAQFAAALGTVPAPSGFEPLPLKQTAPQPAAMPQPAPASVPGALGRLIDIRV